MPITPAALKTELLTDPLALGYAASVASRDDSITAAILNKVRNAISITRSDVTGSEIVDAIDIRDLSASANVLQGSWFESFTQGAQGIALLKPNGNNTRRLDNLLRIMVNTQGSETRLRALAVRDGSRAEQLAGEERYTVTAEQVAVAVTS